MKTLYYTVSSPDSAATKCSLMLYNSLIASLGKVDFKIAIPDYMKDKYPDSVKHIIHPSVKPNKKWQYVGDLKYSTSIYSLNYDSFVYIDSDILWFVDNFDPSCNQITTEKRLLSDPWYKTGWEPKDTSIEGACAGFFCVKKGTGMAMSSYVSGLLSKWNRDECPQREQSAFNQFIEIGGFNKWKNVSDIIVGAARESTKFTRGKMFHFQGWKGTMNYKFEQMRKFINNNNLSNL